MLAGLGTHPLTPPLGVELAGYGYYLKRRATAVRDPLYARALALETDGRRYMVISCDLLGLEAAVVQTVRETLREKWFCAPDNVMVVSIHTHSGPAVKYHEGCGELNPLYVEQVAPAVLAACEKAFGDMQPVTGIDCGKVPMHPLLIFNRTAEDGPLDPNVRTIWLRRRDAADIALVSLACHAVTRGRASDISADYPGQVCRILADRGVRAMFLNGVCGDIDPVHPHEGDLAERFAGAVIDACLSGENTARELSVLGGREVFALRLQHVTKADIRAAAANAAAHVSIPGGDMVAHVWEAEMLEKFHTLADAENFNVSWLSIGGVPIVALPFEGFTRTGALIREATGMNEAFILGCADEILGYLPTLEDIARGAYAALESTFLYKRLPPLPGEAERLGMEIGKRIASKTGEGLHEND